MQTQFVWVCACKEATCNRNRSTGGLNVAMQIATRGPSPGHTTAVGVTLCPGRSRMVPSARSTMSPFARVARSRTISSRPAMVCGKDSTASNPLSRLLPLRSSVGHCSMKMSVRPQEWLATGVTASPTRIAKACSDAASE